jgi:hypothetical protein
MGIAIPYASADIGEIIIIEEGAAKLVIRRVAIKLTKSGE